MSLKIYPYQNCGTCREALQFLDVRAVKCTTAPGFDRPLTQAEPKKAIEMFRGNIARVFKTSGQNYKRLNRKEKLPKLSESEAIHSLARNGRSRPDVYRSRRRRAAREGLLK